MRVELFKFTSNLNNWLYNNGTTNITFGGEVYEGIAIERSEIEVQVDKAELTIKMPYDKPPANLFKSIYPFNLNIQIIDYESGITIWVGKVLSCSINLDKGEAELKCITSQILFENNIPNRTYSIPCSWDLYSPECGVLSSNYVLTLNVDELTVSGTQISHPSIGNYADGWFTMGYVELQFEYNFITKHVGDTITILYPLQTLDENNIIKIYAGCDKKLSTCKNKFNNSPNFGGFPFIPKTNFYTEGW